MPFRRLPFQPQTRGLAIPMRFYGQFSPPVDQFIFERYFRERGRPGTYIECGAFDGITESSCFVLAESLGWKAINIEASPMVFKKLTVNRPNATNLHLALSDRNGHVSFLHVHHPTHGVNFGNGSVQHQPEHRASLDAEGCSYSTHQVRAITYRDLVQNIGLSEIELMVLDIEGHEMAALNGMEGSSVLPEVFCIEFGHIGLERLNSRMRSLGYEFDTISHANAFYFRNDVAPTYKAPINDRN
ncbi:FkbM family methyltransferase [Microvirga subterranea]|uniref:FkbM family methyltransferase n=1 Tax=Microvirga subterranea TaxID=186651 RepID=A0A370HKG0_9HYPH|nr:FkbM family methyltransferase [Microvirga subterranea]